MSHIFHIGAVKEIKASELTTKDIIIHKNEPKNIASLEMTNTRVRVSLNYLASGNKWDLSLTKGSTVYILGARRVTGLKERKS